MIVVQPMGGLCNRLRVMDSAIAQARKHRSELYVLWILAPDFNCRFSELFEVPTGVTRLVEVRKALPSRVLARLLRETFSHLAGCRYVDNERMLALLSEHEKDLDVFFGERSVFTQTCERFDFSVPPYKLFRPLPHLRQIIDSYKTNDQIGVHIRRTDHVESVMYSPTAAFIDRMRGEVEKNAAVRFFVATDDPAVEELLRSHFPGRIDSHPKRSLSRNHPLALQDAVIDLYSLANCGKLIGSYWSSFTEAAHLINGIEPIIIRET